MTDQNKVAAEAHRRKSTMARPVRAVRGSYRANGDRTDSTRWVDVTGWWRDAGLLSRLGPALAGYRDRWGAA